MRFNIRPCTTHDTGVCVEVSVLGTTTTIWQWHLKLGSFTTPWKVHVAIVPALHCMGSNVQGNGDQEARNGVTKIHTTPLDIEASMSAVHFYTHNTCARSPQTRS